MGWGALALFVLLLVVEVGRWRSGRPPGHAPPPVSSRTGRAEAAALAGRISTFVDALEAEPAIRAALGLTEETAPEQALARWMRARQTYRRRVEVVRHLAAGVDALPPDRRLADALAELQLLEGLLDLRLPEVEPLFPAGEGSGVWRAGRRLVRIEARPELGGYGSEDADLGGRRDGAWLNRGGRRWVRVFVRECHVVTRRGEPWLMDELTARNYFGVRFRHPLDPIPDVLHELATEALGSTAPEAPEAQELRLHPVAGDLMLAFVVYDWQAGFLGRLALRGRRDGAWLRATLCLQVPPEKATDERFGFTVRVDGALLPQPLEVAEVHAYGLQPVGNPSPTVNLQEVYQLVCGSPEAPQDAAGSR